MVTGTLGDSAAGLSVLQHKLPADGEERSFLIRRHQLPELKLDVADIMRKLPCRAAMNDISDGLASEVREIAEDSHVSLVIDKDALPASRALLKVEEAQRLNFMLYSGEDYELLISIPKEMEERIRSAFTEKRLLISKIGEVIEPESGPGFFFRSAGHCTRLGKSGYNYFNQ